MKHLQLLALLFSLTLSTLADANKYNVVFIAVDDLRTELGCYGVDEIRTPAIDRFAETSLRFTNHFVQVPTCGASRYALLTGRRPSVSGGYGNASFHSGKSKLSRKQLLGAQTLPELFRRSGYHTTCIGKVSHMPDGRHLLKYDGKGSGEPELPNAWDEMPYNYGSWKYGWGCFFAYANGKHRQDGSSYRPVMEFPDVEDNELPDGMAADLAIEKLAELKTSKKRFFLAVGFFKPHLPFVAPAKYQKMYDTINVK
ncbi:iduronate sulfatase, partial [bacterium M21]